MAQTIVTGAEGAFAGRPHDQAMTRTASPSYQAYQILHAALVIAPVVAGLDKFFHILVNWDMYLLPSSPGFPLSADII